MSSSSIRCRRSKFWLLSLMAVTLFVLTIPAISYADGTQPDPPVQDPSTPPGTNSVAPADDPTVTVGIEPEMDSLTKLEILLLTLMATF